MRKNDRNAFDFLSDSSLGMRQSCKYGVNTSRSLNVLSIMTLLYIFKSHNQTGNVRLFVNVILKVFVSYLDLTNWGMPKTFI